MSALPRLLNCDGALVLPRAENHSPWADSGHDEHDELMRQVITGTLPDRLARIVPPGSRAEVKVAIDVSTGEGRIIGEGGGRDYGALAPYEIAGSIDVLGIVGDTVIVVDWKTGFKDVDPAERNWQMFGYALAACRALGKTKAIVRIAYTNQPGQPIDEHELEPFDLADFAERLKQLHTRESSLKKTFQQGVVPTTREGAWCRHCPSKSVCASKNALLVQFASKGLAVVGDSQMTRDRAAGAYAEVIRIEQLVKDARARLETYVDENGPIDLGEGRMFGRYVRGGTRRLDGNKAVQAIAEIVGEQAKEFEAMAIERKTSQAAIERAAKMFGPKRGAAKLKAQIVARIDELGGVTHGPDSMPIGEFVANKNEPAQALDVAEVNRLLADAG